MSDSGRPRNLAERLRHTLFGAPIPTSKAHHERLSPVVGLAVFSSDSLSSVAYASEAILAILILFATQGQFGALSWMWPLSLAIVALIVVIAFSYTQTIHAYPQGGGSYIVASDNLGFYPFGLIAGAALLIDYVLTVAVSVAAGVAALVSAFPALHNYLVYLTLFFILLVGWANLRGLKESGTVFAIPTYGFVIAILTMLGTAIFKTLTHAPVVQNVISDPKLLGSEASFPLIYIVLRAFAAGCTALTGIEAVSDGVQAFRPPEAKNAAMTLRNMAVLLSIMFLGVGWAAMHLPNLSLLPAHNPAARTVVSQIAAFSFGDGSIGFYVVQISTMLILILAANTAYADFPRLCSFIARDGFLPRPLARQGDRLVFHNGIIVLSVAAALLVVYFNGELEQLLPLYAVGVFTAFTLSQAGMVVHWRKKRSGAWRRSMAINFVGGAASFAVLLIIAITKFTEGAWLVLILIPLIYAMFVGIKRRYASIAAQLAVTDATPIAATGLAGHTSILLVPRVHQGILSALNYAKAVGVETRAVHVVLNEKALPETRRLWERHGQGIPLAILSSPYRSLIGPVLDYVDELLLANPDQHITVIVPEAVARNPFHKLLQENVAQQLKQALASRKNVVVANVRYFLN